MPEEFEGDLNGAVFWGAELKGATFRDVDLTGVRISHAYLVDVEIDAQVDRLVVNGVDVTEFVNERDPWHPLRTMIRAADVEGQRAAWEVLEQQWGTTVAKAQALEDAARHESVGGEWSFVETLRHVVFAIDKWCSVPVLGEPFQPLGLPNRGSIDFPWPGLELDRSPSFDEALAAFDDRSARVRAYLATATAADLDPVVEVLENGPHPVRACIQVVLEEAFWHNRYARRDLEALGA
jgi:hypothetical protein